MRPPHEASTSPNASCISASGRVEGANYMEIDLGSTNQLQLIRVTAEHVELVAPLFDAYRQFYGQPPDPEGALRFLAGRLGQGESVIFAVVEGERALGFT